MKTGWRNCWFVDCQYLHPVRVCWFFFFFFSLLFIQFELIPFTTCTTIFLFFFFFVQYLQGDCCLPSNICVCQFIYIFTHQFHENLTRARFIPWFHMPATKFWFSLLVILSCAHKFAKQTNQKRIDEEEQERKKDWTWTTAPMQKKRRKKLFSHKA